MAEIVIDYGKLDKAAKYARCLNGEGGFYAMYGSDLKTRLQNKLVESALTADEPKGNTYVSDAYTQIDGKRTAISDAKQAWTGLETNLKDLKTFIDDQDKAVETSLATVCGQYTDYSGVGGFIACMSDMLYYGVAVNSSWLTRNIAQWCKEKKDDLDAAIADTKDFFKHGEGRYVLNIVKSNLTLGLEVAGLVASILAIPFTGGTSAFFAVSLVGVVAGSAALIIHTVDEKCSVEGNLKALTIEDDPGMARFYSDTSSYSDHVRRTQYSSPEEYKKSAALGKGLDTAEKVCVLAQGVTTFATTVFSGTVIKNAGGAAREVKGFVMSRENITSNVLKKMGIMVAHETYETTLKKTLSGDDEWTEISKAGVTHDVKAGLGSAVIEDTVTTSEYNSLISSQEGMTQRQQQYIIREERSTTTIDYSKAWNSELKDQLDYQESLDKAQTDDERDKIRSGHRWKNVKKGTKEIKKETGSFLSEEDKSRKDSICDLVKMTPAGNFISDYLFDFSSDNIPVYRRLGGTRIGGAAFDLYDEITGDEAA